MMKHAIKSNSILTALALCGALAALPSACAGNPGQENTMEGTRQMIEKPIRDYIESWYDKDVDRMRQALHPALVKRHPDASRPNGLRDLSLDDFLNVIPQYGGQGGSGRIVDIRVFDSTEAIATAEVLSNDYADYVHLGLVNGRWQIINVLWDFKSGRKTAVTDELKAEISAPVRDYVEGWYDKDDNRLAGALHPALAKRNLDPSFADGVHQYSRSSLLADLAAYGGTNGQGRTLEIEFLDIQDNIASVKVLSNSFVDYLHIGRTDGRWQIINALWAFR